MYIIGAGRTKFGVLNNSLKQMTYEAMNKAISDSPITINDIDAIYLSNFLGAVYEKQLHMNSIVSSLIPERRIPVIRIETACASGATALHQAILSSGKFKNIMVVGAEKMTHSTGQKSTENLAMAGDRELDQKNGLIFPACYALVAQQHMMKYKTKHEDFSLVSLKNHKNANLNSLAHFYYKKVTMEMIRNSPMIATPLNLFDCSPISDGAAALVISKEKRNDSDVKIIGSALATDNISLSQRKNLTSFMAAKIAAKEAFKQAKITPKDLDIIEVHDCFTIAELVAMEDIGLCKLGESKNMVREERTTLNGDIPINTDGGLKANGHPIGASSLAEIYEIVLQLRGKAGKRQVADANTGLSHSIGGVGGTATIHIFQRV